MTTTDRTGADTATAPVLSVAERARLDKIESTPACDEDTVERVARAIWVSDGNEDRNWYSSDVYEHYREDYRVNARAAIDALKPAPGTDSSGQITCGHLSPSINLGGDADAERFMCELPFGHGGAHQRDNGDGLPPMRWIEADNSGQAMQRVLDLCDAADARLRSGVPMSAAEHIIDRGDHTVKVGAVRAAVTGPQRDHDEEGGQ